jgi:hypothetical protein
MQEGHQEEFSKDYKYDSHCLFMHYKKSVFAATCVYSSVHPFAAAAPEPVVAHVLIEIDGQQLKGDAEVAAEVEVAAGANDVAGIVGVTALHVLEDAHLHLGLATQELVRIDRSVSCKASGTPWGCSRMCTSAGPYARKRVGKPCK